MKTIEELERYFEENGYSFQELSIGKHHAYQGYVIEKAEGRYNFSCSERGNKMVLKSFDKEEDLVKYALDTIDKSKWAKAHLLASTYSEREMSEIESMLEERNIRFRRNDIPYYKEGRRLYRIFVFGNDMLKLKDINMK